jgi:Mce-associated membrane protein
VATVLLGILGAWATASAQNLRNAGSQNVALTDRAATAKVSHQVSTEVNTIFSYTYADTAKTKQAAQHVLTGPAVQAYDRLFALVQHNAPAEKLVVTTKVVSSGVEFLTSSRARVLLFANQQDTLAGTGQTSYGGAMLAVTAVRVGGQWKIQNIDTFTNGA